MESHQRTWKPKDEASRHESDQLITTSRAPAPPLRSRNGKTPSLWLACLAADPSNGIHR